MRLILHIFRKDARHLYPEILIVVGLTIAFAWTAPVQWIYSLNGPFAVSGDVTVFMAPILRVILPDDQGLLRHFGLSNVSPEQLSEAQTITEIVCMQNLYNVAHTETMMASSMTSSAKV